MRGHVLTRMPRRWLPGFKRATARLLYTIGALQLLVRLRFRRQAVVLTYHRVLSNDAAAQTWSHPAIVVRRETFEAHLQVLSRLFHVLTLEQFLAHLEETTPFRGPCCLITFDDGWRDTFEEAWPALRRYGLPAVVFVPVDVIGTDRAFWQEHLGYQLYAAWERCRRDESLRLVYARMLPSRLGPVLDATPADVRDVIYSAVQSLKSAAAGGVDPWAVVQSLETANGSGVGTSVDRLMTWNEVRAMADAGIAFGGHGATHRILTSIPAAEAIEEVECSSRRLERELRRRPLVFSYPNGDWNPDVAESVRRAGFCAAFSTARGPAPDPADRFSVCRVNVHEKTASSPSQLLATLAGVW